MKKNKKTDKGFVLIVFSKLKSVISNNFLEKSIISLNKITKKTILSWLTLNFFIGIAILTYTNTFCDFFPHLICLTLNIFITLTIGSEYADTVLFLDEEIAAKIYHEKNIELRIIYKRFRYKALHNLNFILCFIVLAVFFWGIFSQHYIKLDLVGCYAVYMVSLTVSISVIGYAQYLWLLWFLYRISYCSSMLYNKIMPAYTPFLVKIGVLTNHAKWCFFIEGFLYVFEYFILIPNGNVSLSNINMPDKTSFLITWGVIFVVIILAFPIIIYIQESLLSKIVNNLKKQSMEILFLNLDTLIMENTEMFPQIYMRNQMINNLISSPDYPVKVQRLGPSVVATATSILHVVNLINQYPELKTFLVNRLF